MKRVYQVLEHKIFTISMYIKRIYGIIECGIGTILLFLNSKQMISVVQILFGHELIEDPKDFFGNILMNAASNMSLRMHEFISLYILIHGLLNVGLVLALMTKKKWAFPIAGGIIGIILLYEIYQFFHGHSITLLALIIVDICILLLLHFEYKRQFRKH
jgi:uncharacterized membrane protein